jgi:glutaredoxin
MKTELIMYSRTTGCPFITLAKRVLDDYAVPYREIFIDRDNAARQQVLNWTGFLSVPTLVAAPIGSNLPVNEPSPLTPGSSPRGINRGPMITEPNMDQLLVWLTQHGFIEQAAGQHLAASD